MMSSNTISSRVPAFSRVPTWMLPFPQTINDFNGIRSFHPLRPGAPISIDSRSRVWRVTSCENLRGQVLVFWVAVMLDVALATLFTHLVENVMADRTNLVRGAAVFVAQLLGLGSSPGLAASSSWTGGSSSWQATCPSTPTGSPPYPVDSLKQERQVVPVATSTLKVAELDRRWCASDGHPTGRTR
jgi:hypothetical protein